MDRESRWHFIFGFLLFFIFAGLYAVVAELTVGTHRDWYWWAWLVVLSVALLGIGRKLRRNAIAWVILGLFIALPVSIGTFLILFSNVGFRD